MGRSENRRRSPTGGTLGFEDRNIGEKDVRNEYRIVFWNVTAPLAITGCSDGVLSDPIGLRRRVRVEGEEWLVNKKRKRASASVKNMELRQVRSDLLGEYRRDLRVALRTGTRGMKLEGALDPSIRPL